MPRKWYSYNLNIPSQEEGGESTKTGGAARTWHQYTLQAPQQYTTGETGQEQQPQTIVYYKPQHRRTTEDIIRELEEKGFKIKEIHIVLQREEQE